MDKLIKLIQEKPDLTLRSAVENLEEHGESPEDASILLIEALNSNVISVNDNNYCLTIN